MYLIITLAKQSAFVGKVKLSMTVPVNRYQNIFILAHTLFFYNYNEVKHVLESVYINVVIKYQYQPLCPFFAEVRQKKTYFFAYAIVGHWYLRKVFFFNQRNQVRLQIRVLHDVHKSSKSCIKIHLQLKPLFYPLKSSWCRACRIDHPEESRYMASPGSIDISLPPEYMAASSQQAGTSPSNK